MVLLFSALTKEERRNSLNDSATPPPAASAFERWLIWFLIAASNSPKVRSYPSGMKSGSYPNPPAPAGVKISRPPPCPRTSAKSPRLAPGPSRNEIARSNPLPQSPPRQFRQQMPAVVFIRSLLARIARGVDPRRSAQGIDFQPGIIRQHQAPGKRRGCSQRLDHRVFLEGRTQPPPAREASDAASYPPPATRCPSIAAISPVLCRFRVATSNFITETIPRFFPATPPSSCATARSASPSLESGFVVATATTRMPARCAASIPTSASSNTTHRSGGTPIFCAAQRKTSGSGLPWLTSSAVTSAEKASPQLQQTQRKFDILPVRGRTDHAGNAPRAAAPPATPAPPAAPARPAPARPRGTAPPCAGRGRLISPASSVHPRIAGNDDLVFHPEAALEMIGRQGAPGFAREALPAFLVRAGGIDNNPVPIENRTPRGAGAPLIPCGRWPAGRSSSSSPAHRPPLAPHPDKSRSDFHRTRSCGNRSPDAAAPWRHRAKLFSSMSLIFVTTSPLNSS